MWPIKMKFKDFSLFIFLCFLVLSCKKINSQDVLAKVAEENITVFSFNQAYLRQAHQYPDVSHLKSAEQFQIKQQILEDLMDEYILAHAAKQAGLELSEQDMDQHLRWMKVGYSEREFEKLFKQKGIDYPLWLEAKKRQVLGLKFLDKKFENLKVSEEEIKKYYEQHPEEFKEGDQFHIRQLVTEKEERAKELLERLKKGENFARLATDYSISPDREMGGDLGFVEMKNMPEEFKLAFELKPGQMSDVVKSNYGYHIFKMIEKRDARMLSYEEVKSSLEEQLKQNLASEKRAKLVEQLKTQIPIKVELWMLKKIELPPILENQDF